MLITSVKKIHIDLISTQLVKSKQQNRLTTNFQIQFWV